MGCDAFLEICDVKTSEKTLFHPNIDDIKSDAHEHKADSGLLYDVPRERESRHKELDVAGVARCLENNELSRKSDRLKERADQETLNAVRNEPRLLKSDVTPLASPQLKENEEHYDPKDFIDKALCKHRLVRSYEEHLCRMNDKADNEHDN